MKTISLTIVLAAALVGCASVNEYQIYAENTAKVVNAVNASEAACFLVVAEGVKGGDNSTKTAITTQIDKCKKTTPKIEPPKKSWHGLW
jgi:uncharacterized lipoprotein YmbA